MGTYNIPSVGRLATKPAPIARARSDPKKMPIVKILMAIASFRLGNKSELSEKETQTLRNLLGKLLVSARETSGI